VYNLPGVSEGECFQLGFIEEPDERDNKIELDALGSCLYRQRIT
jgi:hypothetical protein